ncbi:MAG: conjugal transfer protein TrbH [Mesorhizobium sp.]|uniref:conjugal transfer protein TrbH n=1 Tax=Mesorhizobium sp. TaxID=1871066 RepID=UPI000FE890FD|nr:conjugal transfer protein TrbH [Mesorhizobium sp.]RWF86807.1 MAG: conjugal transfer protein TrbH [Mesorhizobium sp.]
MPDRRSCLSLLGLAVVAGFLAGCQSLDGGGVIASSSPPEISGAAANAIAGDMVSRLAEQIGPGTATIRLKPDSTPFGEALEVALKRWGYAVVTDQKPDDKKLIPLAYVIDSYEGHILARLSTTTVELGRAYDVTPTGATAASPLSVMRRG